MEIKLYYNDSDIVVAEKPFGVSSQLSQGENMVTMLSNQLDCEIFPVHRLDIQTTGLIVFAKNQFSASELSRQIQDKSFKKEYLCLCHGEIEGKGEMRDFLYHDRVKNKSFVVDKARKGAKEAILEYEVAQKGEQLSKVRVKLKTGRTHQIRVQFASRGNMLYGDGKYGAKDNDKIALHSCKITFMHPKTKTQMEFESEPTSDVWQMLK